MRRFVLELLLVRPSGGDRGGIAPLRILDGGHVDEVHAFIAPKLLGGGEAPSPIGGHGRSLVAEAGELECPTVRQVGGDADLVVVVVHVAEFHVRVRGDLGGLVVELKVRDINREAVCAHG